MNLSERLAGDLAFLAQLPSKAHVAEFCRQALEALGAGVKRAVLKQAAAALSVDPDVVSGCIMGLSLLFLEAAKVRP